ncbi:MAG: hypothetical protein J7K68_01855 [Candidatus Diapherotrites archaeon]|nr:hypothetical protein [Candidatus Diapherotrites archaeon]
MQEHIHPHANEWIIFTKGRFEVSIDSEKTVVDTLSSDGAHILFFPKGHKHGVKFLSDMLYFVLRDGVSKTIY